MASSRRSGLVELRRIPTESLNHLPEGNVCAFHDGGCARVVGQVRIVEHHPAPVEPTITPGLSLEQVDGRPPALKQAA